MIYLNFIDAECGYLLLLEYILRGMRFLKMGEGSGRGDTESFSRGHNHFQGVAKCPLPHLKNTMVMDFFLNMNSASTDSV